MCCDNEDVSKHYNKLKNRRLTGKIAYKSILIKLLEFKFKTETDMLLSLG